mmetsp:Transcript_3353/g.8815  ORF Transcript_3353/g.8815 Transcript_3353/m.8815 type:complete len:219 (+) Transcript_3353:607-1263(+)
MKCCASHSYGCAGMGAVPTSLLSAALSSASTPCRARYSAGVSHCFCISPCCTAPLAAALFAPPLPPLAGLAEAAAAPAFSKSWPSECDAHATAPLPSQRARSASASTAEAGAYAIGTSRTPPRPRTTRCAAATAPSPSTATTTTGSAAATAQSPARASPVAEAPAAAGAAGRKRSATILRPRCSSALIVAPKRWRCTPACVMMTSVCSRISLPGCAAG